MKQLEVTPEEFDLIVNRLEERAGKMLCREACIGSSTRIKSEARLGDEEQISRLTRLRGKIAEYIPKACRHFDDSSVIMETNSLFYQLDAAETALTSHGFARLERDEVLGQLRILKEALTNATDLFNCEVSRLAKSIDPNVPLELLTPDEIKIAFDDCSQAMGLADLIAIEDELRAYLDETSALLQGMTASLEGKGGKGSRRGRYKHPRGDWITAHLLGLAMGLGLKPSRNDTPAPESPLFSASDAVAIVICRLRGERDSHTEAEATYRTCLNDPAAKAVLKEMPKNRGNVCDTAAIAINIMKKFVRRQDPIKLEARRIGEIIGKRQREES